MLLRDAVRHFARHGDRAAEQAQHNARQAFFDNRRGDYLHWLAICRALDRQTIEFVPQAETPG